MSVPVVTLGGVTLGGDVTYSWELAYGVRPAEQLFLLSEERAKAIALGSPLTFGVAGVAKPLKVEHVYALEVLAAQQPQQRTVRVADRRWLWPRKWVASSFNVRRASGDFSLAGEAGTPIELQQLQPEIRYAKWSLNPPENGSEPWTALQVLDFVFGKIEQPYRVVGTLPQVEVQDLVLDDDGASAVERVLAFLPGADVFMDYDGTAVVLNTLDGGAGGTRTRGPIPGLERKHTSGGDIQISDRSALRPASVVVLFTPEVEVRFDYTESGSRTRDTAQLVNVAPSPDVTLELTDSQGVTRTVARGSYVPLETLFTTWPAFGVDSQQLSMAKMARFGFGAGILEQVYARDTSFNVDPVSAGRVRAAVDSWRQLFQIDELFMQRLLSIRANRVAILNAATGLRARSEAYCDFTRRPNKRNPAIKGLAESKEYGWAVEGYADLLEDATPAPALVSVQDNDAGVIRVAPQLDPWGLSDAIMLGYPGNTGKTPTQGGDAEANRTGIDVYAQWAACEMRASFQLSTVLTCIPASPNTIDRFHKVTVQASAVGRDGTGPTIYARVFPGVMTARYAWSDDATTADAIRNSILQGTPIPETQLVNRKDVDDVARATAQAVYANLLDQPTTTSGPVEVDMNPDLKPAGPLGRVRHGLENGITVSTVTATGYRKPVDLWPFLGASTRRAVLKVLNAGGQ